uniref:Uncharacterized protein n=1 Tax=Pseudomonas aeruginosa TaxID=287 RepID=A0A7S5YBP7_PSEAI|nr:hypothetical protein [Pseudomonas aeruginosa]
MKGVFGDCQFTCFPDCQLALPPDSAKNQKKRIMRNPSLSLARVFSKSAGPRSG